MNRRSFFARMLGAACLAVAERVLPSSIGAVKPVFAEPDWQQWGNYRVYFPDEIKSIDVSKLSLCLNNLPESLRRAMICVEWPRLV